MFDLIIVGSGPAGVWAAWQAARRGLKPLMLDVGHRPANGEPLASNLYDLRRQDARQADYLVGKDFESLHNLHRPFCSPKVKAPRYGFVTEGGRALAPIQSDGFDVTQSFAQGGLANAWGASMYRYDDKDLAAFPFDAAALAPYYRSLAAEIGISGANDDLAEHFGFDAGELQPPLELDRIAARLLGQYESGRPRFLRRGIRMGRPALALLSRDHGNRRACTYDNLSFWQPGLSYVYAPGMTLDALRRDGKLDYRDGFLVERFSQSEDGVSVQARGLNGNGETFRARKLILAAGAINSARIVLRSFDDTHSRLPLLDNPSSLTPFFHPAHIGGAVQAHSHGLAQLNALYEGPAWDSPVKGTFYGYSSPLASDVFKDFPLSARGVLAADRYFLPAVTALQLFYKAERRSGNDLSLSADGGLVTRAGAPPSLGAVEGEFIRALRPGGFLSHRRLSKTLPAGNGIHYAGTLPMCDDETVPYRTDASGRLLLAKHVHVADAAVFPELPAKNHSFTLMAVAMRVADAVADTLGPR